mgnify:CR=1 FL=1
MAQKTIICLRGKENTGKTTSIRECYKLMTGKEPENPGDFNKRVKAGEKTEIGFSSWGDPNVFNGKMANEEELERLLPYNCIVVITACRSRGNTIEAVERLAKEYGYKVIYIDLMHGDTYHSLYAKKNAEVICEIIDSLNLSYFSGITSCKAGKFIPIN